MNKQIKIKTEGPIEIIEFCNPPMNFISNVMLEELYNELIRVKKDSSIRVLVLTGGMEDSFITHYDVSELLEYSKNGLMPPKFMNDSFSRRVYKYINRANNKPWLDKILFKIMAGRSDVEKGIYCWARSLEILDTMPKPVIAAISGMCLGGGCELSLCCDFRYMARHKKDLYRIGLPEILVGIIPGGTGTHIRLPGVIGEAKSLEMLMTGKLYTPDEAEAMGLIHKVFAHKDLMPAVMELAARLSRGAPIALASIRKNVRQGSRAPYHEGRAIDMAVTNIALKTSDAKQGMSKYIEKTSQYTHFDLEVALKDAELLRQGREVVFKGE